MSATSAKDKEKKEQEEVMEKPSRRMWHFHEKCGVIAEGWELLLKRLKEWAAEGVQTTGKVECYKYVLRKK